MNNFDKKISDKVKSYLDENVKFSTEESDRIHLKIQQGYHKLRKFNPLYWTVLASAATIFLILSLSFLKGSIGLNNHHDLQGSGNENFSLSEGEELAVDMSNEIIYTHQYNISTRVIKKTTQQPSNLYSPINIETPGYNEQYDKYFDLLYLTGDNIVELDNSFIYLRKYRIECVRGGMM
ncbi:hypothetical protein [Heyndrickxia sp. FSL W8-0423]|uniref:hypothetical protein n=1 Tax=Heyndrickxia sp. FSL W8-0423 TaxID=2921601 RepID=UPI0030F954F3